MYYIRKIQENIEKDLFKGKVIIIYGARRVGKTTLVQAILQKHSVANKYINCELLQNKTALETTNSELLKDFIGDSPLVVLDEAQNIKNIGLVLKILVDTFPKTQIIATGSSSFELANKISEPLTGRAYSYTLYPLSFSELRVGHDLITLEARLDNMLRYGLYPSIVGLPEDEAGREINLIASNYLYKDVLTFGGIKNADTILNLLRALALQIGQEVSLTELAQLLGHNQRTIASYIEILEQCFIIFKLRSFSRNLRKEIGKRYKVYFYDLGIRNSLLQNFNPLALRNDVGALWENFLLNERGKKIDYERQSANRYFWRTYDQKEIDYLEESAGKIFAYEFKWGPTKAKAPTEFLKTYPGTNFMIVNRQNYWDFIS
ncbi:MAG: ATP-binding protein [Candidatus Magasanikbacteria bacterium]|nr:ATP-binding protein [Candidatus Magasanikbacteria bacterium]